MIKRLYIIGNGLDLHHGIKSSYADFHRWLGTGWNYNDVEKYFGNVDLWSSLEENMAKFNYEDYAANNFSFENGCLVLKGHHKVQGEVLDFKEQRLEEWHTAVLKRFGEWLKGLSTAVKGGMLSLTDEESVYLSFNYTHTLEDQYHIAKEQVFHIHGEAGDPWEQLRLGHNGRILEPTRDLSNPHKEVLDVDASFSKDAMDDVLSWRKPVQEIIARNEPFWNVLREVNSVYVLGFSCGCVDLPYIEKIVSVVSPKAKWHVTWFAKKERTELPAALCRCGVKDAEAITWKSLEARNTSKNELN